MVEDYNCLESEIIYLLRPLTAVSKIKLTAENLQIIYNKDSFTANNPTTHYTDIPIFNLTPHMPS
jgi:hypothetical protein